MQGTSAAVPSARAGTVDAKFGAMVRNLLVLALLAGCAAGCGLVDAVFDGFKHAKAVENDLVAMVGVKPAVGFNWHNGRLTSVTVTFPSLLQDKPLQELAGAARTAVGKEFKQRADDVVLAFSLGPSETSAAQADQAQNKNLP
ncbi:hypothetical protein [Bradyrhizobium sp. CER78]|uniref:hypothetical protein n=1 Tax=Bradyrhizobium sp. CER78 TaxID=3039162 RepID=UPI00244991A3|nr:hypothetical protein [Bradyrhizobium sp. CER78]MDH2386898.1 hypothetical protein [Bradyrhizobium sp. CER78]